MGCILKQKNTTCEYMSISKRYIDIPKDSIYLACDMYDIQSGKCILFTEKFDKELENTLRYTKVKMMITQTKKYYCVLIINK